MTDPGGRELQQLFAAYGPGTGGLEPPGGSAGVQGRDTELRRRWEQLILRHYHAALARRGAAGYPWEQLLRDYTWPSSGGCGSSRDAAAAATMPSSTTNRTG